MSTMTIGARMSPRELAIITVMMQVEAPTTAEITRYAYRRFLGMTHEEARGSILAERKSLASTEVADKMISVRMPEDIVTQAHAKLTDMPNISTRHRYIMALATTTDPDEALELATRTRGWVKGRSRKEGAPQ